MSSTASATIQETLQTVFGFPAFREGQREIIEKLLAGKSALAVFPTGGGKSLCYQLPALHLAALTVVVSPLIALMKDQIDFLTAKQVPAARLDSTLSWEETKRVYDAITSRSLRLLYIAPERFSNSRFLQRLRNIPISLLVVDEAHCISEWGHNFRPDYLKLARVAENLRVGSVLALTATATPKVAGDICKGFGIATGDYVHTSFYRPNLTLHLTPCPHAEREEQLLARLRERDQGPTIVYVTRRQTAEDIAKAIAARGFPAHAYHAGLNPEKRESVQDWFMRGKDTVVVATIAFGMGIDKADIRYIYHFNLPKSLENYAQEIGRAGRDERESTCELFAAAADLVTLENFIYGDTPTAEAIGAIVREIMALADDFDLSTYEWSYRHDVRQLVLTTLLTYLELLNIIETRGVVYNEYRFQPTTSSAAILARFDAPRADFLRKVFRGAVKGTKWLKLDVAQTAATIQEPRERICKALNYLEEEGLLTLEVSGLRQVYRFRERPADVDGLIVKLVKRFHGREEADLRRVRQVVEMVEHQGCASRYLVEYFGETMKRDCGHCGWCLGRRPGPLAQPGRPDLGDAEKQRLGGLIAESHEALARPRQLARFLCGIHSPATSRARLPRHPLFGAFITVPFAAVLAFVEELAGDTAGQAPPNSIAATTGDQG